MASSDHREAFTTPFDSAHAIGQVAPDESLVSRARALGPFIREHAAITERERRLARPVLEAMREQDSSGCSRRGRWAGWRPIR